MKEADLTIGLFFTTKPATMNFQNKMSFYFSVYLKNSGYC